MAPRSNEEECDWTINQWMSKNVIWHPRAVIPTTPEFVTMLKFLARDGCNAEAIAFKLKRSSDASAVTSKAKKLLSSKSSGDTLIPPVVPKPGTIQLVKVHVPA